MTLTGVCLLAGCAQTDPTTAIPESPTFTDDVAPILHARCATCHRPGQPAPFSLLTYADAKAHAALIGKATTERRMPPWLPEPGYGDFAESRRLTEREIATLTRWLETGAAEGSGALPPSARLAHAWQLGTPDLLVPFPDPYTLPPSDSDVFRTFVIPLDLLDTRYVRGVEFNPDNPHVVHHVVIGVDPTRASRRLDADDAEPGFDGMSSQEFHSPDGHFVGWTPGKVPVLDEPDMSWKLEPGTDLVVQMHMLPSRLPAEIQPTIALHFGASPPTRVPFMVKLSSTTIDIPAGESEYVVEDSYTLPVDVDVLSIYPHAHYLGRDIRVTAMLPDGSMRWLIWIKNWDFDWQDSYRYSSPVALPRGTRITMRITYDNSVKHQRHGTDQPRRVVYGPHSSDEMGDVWLQVLPRRAEDLDVLRRDYVRRGNEADIAAAEQMVRADPQNVLHRNLLGARYLAAGRSGEAIVQLLEALRIDPGYGEAHNNLGTVYLDAGRVAEALVHLRLAASARPDDDRVQFNLGNALQAADRRDDAIRAFERSLVLNPDAPEVHNNLGVLLGGHDDYEGAIAQFRHALALREAYPEAHNNLALALGAIGRFDAAIASASRALELRPGFTEARQNLQMLQATARQQ